MGSQVKRLAQNAMALVAGGIVAQLVFTLLEVLVARKLGAEAYGVFVTAYAWSLIGSVVMGLGTGMWTIQEGSRDHARIPTLLGFRARGFFIPYRYAADLPPRDPASALDATQRKNGQKHQHDDQYAKYRRGKDFTGSLIHFT